MSPIASVSLETDGGPTHCLESGSGPDALVWFPALLDCAAGFGRTMLALRRRLPTSVRLLAVDPPGYGDSPAARDQGLLALDRWGAWCRSLLRELQKRCAGRLIFVGNSSGGVAATLAANEAERCAGLVLVCWCDWRGHRPPDSSVLCPRDRADAERLLERSWHRPPELTASALDAMLEQSRTSRFVDHVSSFDPLRYRIELAAFAGPLVLIGGERDQLVPVAALSETAKARDAAPIHLLPNCGHYPHRERQQEFASLLLTVVEQLLETGRPTCNRGRMSNSSWRA